ncbi:hypothetical protein Tco_0037781 [Tanacetum coccineum]
MEEKAMAVMVFSTDERSKKAIVYASVSEQSSHLKVLEWLKEVYKPLQGKGSGGKRGLVQGHVLSFILLLLELDGLGIPMEVEPLDETQLEDLGLNTCSHDLFPSSKEFPSIDEPEPQPLPNIPFLDVNLGDKRGPEPPIKPISLDSFRMKVVNHLTIHTPPSSHVASFYPRDVYCYYHPCLDDPKKHYGFKPGLLRQSGSLGVDLSKLKMIDDDWKLESKKGSYLGDGLDLQNELGNGIILNFLVQFAFKKQKETADVLHTLNGSRLIILLSILYAACTLNAARVQVYLMLLENLLSAARFDEQ